jgi:uncharacterized protein YhbP (UPF0306 family)
VSDTLRARLHTFLREHNVLTLAYADADGPAACALWFAIDDALACYFLSAATTRHGAALAEGGPVAFTIQRDRQSWQGIQGVQGRGHCAPLPPDQQAAAWALYTTRFPLVTQQFPDIQAALARATLWRILPSWLRLIDNTRGFGHKEELHLTPP